MTKKQYQSFDKLSFTDMTNVADPTKWKPVKDEVVSNPEMVKIVPKKKTNTQTQEMLEAEYAINTSMKPKGLSEK